MTAFDYARSTVTADRLIARFGQAGTLRRPTATGTAYNPVAGDPGSHSCRFVVIEWAVGEVDGSRVLSTDMKVLLAKGSLTIDPAPSDKLVIGGVEHHIIGPDKGRGIKAVAPAGTVVFYELQVRR
jgi:hypothetical protein